MEDEIISNSEKKHSIAPAFGFLGLGIGTIALVVSILSMQKISNTADELNVKISNTESISLETKKISDRIDALAIQLEDLKQFENNRVKKIVTEIDSVLKTITSNINDTRKIVEQNRNTIEEFTKRKPEPVVVTRPTPQPTQPVAEPTPQTTTEAPNSHIIIAGDTFGKLAKKYNVSVQSIIDANPNVNPTRLYIGQKVIINE